MLTIINEKTYEKSKDALNYFTEEMVKVVGEKTILDKDNNKVKQFLYEKIGYTAENGKPFVIGSDYIEIIETEIVSEDWEEEIPNAVLPLIEDVENDGRLTLDYVIEQCEWIMESSESGVTFYGDVGKDEGVAEVNKYLIKYKG